MASHGKQVKVCLTPMTGLAKIRLRMQCMSEIVYLLKSDGVVDELSIDESSLSLIHI